MTAALHCGLPDLLVRLVGIVAEQPSVIWLSKNIFVGSLRNIATGSIISPAKRSHLIVSLKERAAVHPLRRSLCADLRVHQAERPTIEVWSQRKFLSVHFDTMEKFPLTFFERRSTRREIQSAAPLLYCVSSLAWSGKGRRRPDVRRAVPILYWSPERKRAARVSCELPVVPSSPKSR